MICTSSAMAWTLSPTTTPSTTSLSPLMKEARPARIESSVPTTVTGSRNGLSRPPSTGGSVVAYESPGRNR
jgi:hypothetical protein